MFTETGKELSILIVTETDKDWQTFATWYSFYKNLPDAKISLICHRNGKTPFAYFQWAKRLKVPNLKCWPHSAEASDPMNWLMAIKFATDQGLLGENILVTKPLVMATSPFDSKFLKKVENCQMWINEDAWLLRNIDVSEIINKHCFEENQIKMSSEQLCFEAKENDNPVCLVSYKKGCGRWIDTAKGCPFSSAAGLVSTEMTANESRVIELWKKMVPLYYAVA